MGAALALASRGVGQTAPNPPVGCVLVKSGKVIGRGWTQPGGRPHAEAMALAQAGANARGATAYVTLEPCAHVSTRGPACADSLIAAGVARLVVAMQDPDPRSNGVGIARAASAGVATSVPVRPIEAARIMAGFLTRQRLGRPHVTLKLATSLDGKIAAANGASRWITGEAARAHAHLERARCDLIIVGRGTLQADQPRLDVRLPGLEDRSPRRAVLTRNAAPDGWIALESPHDVGGVEGVDTVLVEGGAGAAGAFLGSDLVDRLMIYRALILIGEGRDAIEGFDVNTLADAHGRWRVVDTRMLGIDSLAVYERVRD